MNKYWDRQGKYQMQADLLEKLIPSEGSVPNATKNKALEKFRKAVNCYYDLYNNGLCNRKAEFARIFKISPNEWRETWRGYGRYNSFLYDKTEEMMDEIILAAAREQNVIADDYCI